MTPKQSIEQQLAVLTETVEFYAEDPTSRRAVIPGTHVCKYLTPEKQMCAVGRMLTPEGMQIACTHRGSVFALIEKFFLKGLRHDAAFKEKYQGLPEKYLRELQRLHDANHYWNPKGLSPEGTVFLESIKSNIKNSVYT